LRIKNVVGRDVSSLSPSVIILIGKYISEYYTKKRRWY